MNFHNDFYKECYKYHATDTMQCGAAGLAGCFFGLAACFALTLTGCHPSGDTTSSSSAVPSVTSDAAATITTPKGNTVSVTPQEFYAELQSFTPNPRVSGPAGIQVMQQILPNLMYLGLAEDEGLTPTDAEVETQYKNVGMVQDARNIKPFEQALTDAGLTPQIVKDLQIKPQVAQLKLLTKGATISDADIQTFYNANKDKVFTKPARAHIKRLTFADPAAAQAAAKAIAGGAAFESQVTQSLDKSTPDGDVLQWIPLDPAPPGSGGLVNPIKAAQPGQTTPLIKVNNSNGPPIYWLVKVVEKKDKETVPLDQVKDLIRFQLLQQKAQGDKAAQQALQTSMRDFQTKVKVSIPGQQYASLVQLVTHPAPAP